MQCEITGGIGYSVEGGVHIVGSAGTGQIVKTI